MPDVVIEAKNRLDGKTYSASIVPKRQEIECWLAPTLSAGGKEPQRQVVTLTATARCKSWFGARRSPLLLICYGIGGLQFDTFCLAVQQVLSTCDMSALTGVRDAAVIREICGRHGLIGDQGEIRSGRRATPFVMLFDDDAAARGY